ncbi:hypothetical protein HELRODRAFT_182391 [Helobdella robusta]|uniref:Uncharacterized protein n=1 Tax=Helobdella robusta TaxID=6412 RepID=T1EXX8_HELRO|nr:hypothetical protein HELRODRAFT_182391 [Helobdella robusta]XP_009031467.1 hypothetical protein HELRODRAFT_166242 [Helobdella robusta]ESN90560.1 hypothetical protein HELRODRAFT_166242 [Helobdella robusta]ESN91042.1 hypothetical protein HELRODRAFT_182391 [Helobdella robusta]
MASKPVVINELLYFLTNNIGLLDNEAFVFNVSKFYSQEEIDGSLKYLKNEFEQFKNEIVDKLNLHGTNKIDKLLDCISVLKCFISNNLLEKLAVFVSKDLNRVPRLENVIKVNFESLRCEISELIVKQQAYISNTLEIFKEQLSQVTAFDKQMHQVNEKLNLVASNFNKTVAAVENTSNVDSMLFPPLNNNISTTARFVNKNNKLNNDTTRTPTNNIKPTWGDRVAMDIPSDDNQSDDNFTLVQRNKNKNKPRTLPLVVAKSAATLSVQRKQKIDQTKKVIGRKNDCSSTIRPMKMEPRKKLVYVGKLDQCTSEDVINHLKSINVNAISAIPLTKSIFNKKSSTNNDNNNNSQTSDSKTSAAFRILFLESDLDKVLNEDNWPNGVVLHEWCFFNNHVQQSVSNAVAPSSING